MRLELAHNPSYYDASTKIRFSGSLLRRLKLLIEIYGYVSELLQHMIYTFLRNSYDFASR